MTRNPTAVRSLALCAAGWLVAGSAAVAIAALVAGSAGAASAAVAAAVGLVFPVLSAVALLVPDRRYGTKRFAAQAFVLFLAGFLAKALLFLVALGALTASDGILAGAAYGALAATAVGSLAIDVAIVNGIPVPPGRGSS